MATYGIDLGTTDSCIAYVDESGRPVVLKSAGGEDTTPSVVYFESPDHVVVGREAKDCARLAPELVVEHVNRQMGEDVEYTFHGQDHTPESVSALILRELAHAAQEQTGEEVRDVVITVPAYFGVRQREATRKAGLIAGLCLAQRCRHNKGACPAQPADIHQRLPQCRSGPRIHPASWLGWTIHGCWGGGFHRNIVGGPSNSARVFAEAFYDGLKAGRTLGRAVQEARQAIARDSADPTWLAYSVYGDPAAIVMSS